MFEYVFAFFHLFLLLGLLGYAFYSLFQGNILRFALIAVCLAGYYFLALHKNVKKEIERKKKAKSTK
jgi:4-hydroxybenzoate polyprenyltransferase